MSRTSFIRMEGDCFFYEFHGLNFPFNGPALQKNTVKWEPSTEKIRCGIAMEY